MNIDRLIGTFDSFKISIFTLGHERDIFQFQKAYYEDHDIITTNYKINNFGMYEPEISLYGRYECICLYYNEDPFENGHIVKEIK